MHSILKLNFFYIQKSIKRRIILLFLKVKKKIKKNIIQK